MRTEEPHELRREAGPVVANSPRIGRINLVAPSVARPAGLRWGNVRLRAKTCNSADIRARRPAHSPSALPRLSRQPKRPQGRLGHAVAPADGQGRGIRAGHLPEPSRG